MAAERCYLPSPFTESGLAQGTGLLAQVQSLTGIRYAHLAVCLSPGVPIASSVKCS